MAISQYVSLSGHDDVALFEWRHQWRWIEAKIDNYVIIIGLKSERIGKLIQRIQGSRLFDIKFTSLSFENACRINQQTSWSTSALEALPGKLDIKRSSPSILFLPGDDYLISKEAHLVFSFYHDMIGFKAICFNQHLHPSIVCVNSECASWS